MAVIHDIYHDADAFRKHCLRYGRIVRDDRYDDPQDGKPMRKYAIMIDGYLATIHLKCGEVVDHSYIYVHR